MQSLFCFNFHLLKFSVLKSVTARSSAWSMYCKEGIKLRPLVEESKIELNKTLRKRNV